jgi:hypothetical protein
VLSAGACGGPRFGGVRVSWGLSTSDRWCCWHVATCAAVAAALYLKIYTARQLQCRCRGAGADIGRIDGRVGAAEITAASATPKADLVLQLRRLLLASLMRICNTYASTGIRHHQIGDDSAVKPFPSLTEQLWPPSPWRVETSLVSRTLANLEATAAKVSPKHMIPGCGQLDRGRKPVPRQVQRISQPYPYTVAHALAKSVYSLYDRSTYYVGYIAPAMHTICSTATALSE